MEEMAPTTSQGQLLRREAGWEGSRRRNRDPRDTNRIRGGAARASRQVTAKPAAIKGPSRICGGCAGKVPWLIPRGLRGRPGMPVHAEGVDRRVARDGEVREAAAHRGEVSRGRSTGAVVRREGPNAKPRQRTLVLAVIAMNAANPARGLGGKARG